MLKEDRACGLWIIIALTQLQWTASVCLLSIESFWAFWEELVSVSDLYDTKMRWDSLMPRLAWQHRRVAHFRLRNKSLFVISSKHLTTLSVYYFSGSRPGQPDSASGNFRSSFAIGFSKRKEKLWEQFNRKYIQIQQRTLISVCQERCTTRQVLHLESGYQPMLAPSQLNSQLCKAEMTYIEITFLKLSGTRVDLVARGNKRCMPSRQKERYFGWNDVIVLLLPSELAWGGEDKWKLPPENWESLRESKAWERYEESPWTDQVQDIINDPSDQ